MAERLRFSRDRTPVPGARRLGALTLLFCVTALGFVLVELAPEPSVAPKPMVVEVRGAVPQPGFHALAGAQTLSAALRAAGAPAGSRPDAVLEPGTRVIVEKNSIRLERMDDLLVIGLPIDINAASASALQAIPGLGTARARAIVDHRAAQGPYPSVEALEQVHGLGPRTVEQVRPFVTATPVSPAALSLCGPERSGRDCRPGTGELEPTGVP